MYIGATGLVKLPLLLALRGPRLRDRRLRLRKGRWEVRGKRLRLRDGRPRGNP